jgi:hypothetical protein
MSERLAPVITQEYRRFRIEHPRLSRYGAIATGALAVGLAIGGAGEIITGDPYAAARPLVEAFDHSCPHTPNALDRINHVLNNPHNRNTGGEGPSPNYDPIAFARKLGLHLESSDQAIRSLNRQTTVQGALAAINSYTGPKHHFKFTLPKKPGLVGRAKESLGREVAYYKPGQVPLAELRKDGDKLLDNLSETPTELSAMSGVTKIAIVKTLGGIKKGRSRDAGDSSNTSSAVRMLLQPKDNDFIEVFAHERAHQIFRRNCHTTEADIKEYETMRGHTIHYTGKDSNSKLGLKDPYTSDYGKKSKGKMKQKVRLGLPTASTSLLSIIPKLPWPKRRPN